MNKQIKIFFLILGAVLISLSLVLPTLLIEQLHSNKIFTAENILHQKEKKADELLLEMQNILDHNEEELEQFSLRLQELYKDEGLAFYAFHKNQLVYWSDDAVAFSTDSILSGNQLQKFGNGWYEVKKQAVGEYTFVSLIKLFRCFDHENQYLQPGFAEHYGLGPNYAFTKKKSQNNIHTDSGEFLFAVEIKKKDEIPSPYSYFYNLIYFLSILLILYGLSFIRRKSLYCPFSIAFLVSLRISMLFFGFPESLVQLEIFGPLWYEGTFWIPSFGDLLLYGLLLHFIAYFMQQWIKSLKVTSIIIYYLLPIILFFFSAIQLYLIVSLIQNAGFAMNLNNLLQLNFYSYLGLFLIFILLFSFFIFADATFRKLHRFLGVKKSALSLIISFVALLVLLFWIEKIYALYFLAFLLPLIVIFTKGIKRKYYSLPISLVLILSFSAIAALIIHYEGAEKELSIRKDAIEEFAEEEDPIAEFLFEEIQKKLVKDTLAHHLLTNYWKNEAPAVEYLKNKYFNTYWEKFEVFFTPCFAGDSLMIAPNNYEVDCIEFFRQKIRNEGKMLSANNLFQLDNKTGKISYLAEVPINYNEKKLYLYIEIFTRAFNDNTGYPELLLDKKEINKTIDLDEYSFAIYNNKELVNSAGDFNYSLHWDTRLPKENKAEQLNSGGFNHLLYMNRDNTMFVLSKKKETFFNYLTSLSYLLTFFSILLIPFSYLIPDFPISIRFPKSDFTGKLQLFIIGSLLSTLILFVISTSYYIQEQYHMKNVNAIGDKMRSVIIEIEQELSTQNDLGQNFKDYITFLLIKLSNVFYTDINLYRPDGILYASSRPEIFESGLKGRRMDPQAVHQMLIKQKTEFIQEEYIGEMEYLSAYKPFRNNNNELVAYLNLPYFAKQNQLEKEISAFLVSTVNLYVIIFVLAILVSVFVVNQLSKPLQLIRSKIRKLRLGASNELIQWESNDEIGSLVKEYNRMVVELGENVEQLAKSERESAWKEMAKQVAHEIKNPLTPMKLSIQHLKRAYDDDSEDLDARVERTTQTLIEQIDTLAGIANEFSNFANMPEVKKEQVDLIKSIETAANLYREKDKLEIEVKSETDTAFVIAGKDHIVRIFNNLVKNAVQSIPKKRKGEIMITIKSEENNYWKVDIRDNGEGIAAEQQEKIFIPNFTTKTSGMGLGLAMVKTIMDNLDGKISFESQVGIGTVFSLRFPKS